MSTYIKMETLKFYKMRSEIALLMKNTVIFFIRITYSYSDLTIFSEGRIKEIQIHKKFRIIQISKRKQFYDTYR